MATLLCDDDGTAREVNRAWVDLSGLSRRSSRGRGWLRLFSPQDRGDAVALVSTAAQDGQLAATDFRVTIRDELRWTRWWVHSLGPASLVGLAVADVEDDHLLVDQLMHRATHDPMTGLSVRTHLFDLLTHALRARSRHPTHLALLYIDLDDFKAVNDRFGHGAGDEVLLAVADALRASVRPEDVVARVGGDEFAIMCDHLDAREDVAAIVDRLREALDSRVRVPGSSLRVTASVGVAFADGDETPEALLDRADRAMYRSKRRSPHPPTS